jgi:hypothetical protein
MKAASVILGAVVAFIGIGYALHYLYAAGTQNGAAAVAAAPVGALHTSQNVASEMPVGTGVLKNGDTVTIHGTAIMDTSSGTPAVPYIRYQDAANKLATKQLIFVDERGCSPGAGDFPCVPTYTANGAYPHLTSGEKITVTGHIREDRFLITSMSVDG